MKQKARRKPGRDQRQRGQPIVMPVPIAQPPPDDGDYISLDDFRPSWWHSRH